MKWNLLEGNFLDLGSYKTIENNIDLRRHPYVWEI